MIHNLLVENNIKLADTIAGSMRRSLPRFITFAELKSAAYMGLVSAANKYESTRSNFETYASIKIRGAILDYLRELAWGPRSKPGKLEGLKDQAAKKDSCCDLFDYITSFMNERQKRIFLLHFREEKQQGEIAKELRLSRSRISQIIEQCCDLIRDKWHGMEYLLWE